MIDTRLNPPVRPKVREAINRILRENLAPYGFTGAKIEAREDHDGDPAIFVDAEYELSDEPVDAKVTMAAQSSVHERLLALGEQRFPYLRHHFAEGQPVLGDIVRKPRRRRA